MKRSLREAEQELKAAGFTIVKVTQNKHCKLQVEHSGIHLSLVVPVSPSDRRWKKNLIAHAKRALEQARTNAEPEGE